MTQVAYCEQQKINTKSLDYWFRGRELESQTLTVAPIALHEVASANELKLRHPSGREQILPGAIEPGWLAHLLQEMR